VDNASADGSAEMVAREFPQTHLVASPENLGFARGNNVGLRLLGFGDDAGKKEQGVTRPEAVLLLNPDTELHPGALATLTDFLKTHPHAGGCCPRLNYGDGSFQHSAFRFPGLAQLALDLHPIPRLMQSALNGRYPRRLYDGKRPFPVDFALGAALMMRAEAIDAAGLLDEAYFMYAEEMDWQMRIRQAGWPVFCVPDARVTHYEGQSARQFRRAMTVALWRSRLRYYDKYHPGWKRRLERWMLARGLRKRIMRARAALASGAGNAGELQDQIAAYEEIRELMGQPDRPDAGLTS
ncbi:MAG: glycosyltransferase family 2 protein, partial [Clostridia bacterium]